MIKEIKEQAKKEITEFVKENGVFYSVATILLLIVGLLLVFGVITY